MSGRYINQQQVKLYMNYRDKQLSQSASAAKSGISVRSGRTIEHGQHHTQQPKRQRKHKTRTSPIDQVWSDELEGMLQSTPTLQAMTLFLHLQRTHCDEFGVPLYDRSILGVKKELPRKVLFVQ